MTAGSTWGPLGLETHAERVAATTVDSRGSGPPLGGSPPAPIRGSHCPLCRRAPLCGKGRSWAQGAAVHGCCVTAAWVLAALEGGCLLCKATCLQATCLSPHVCQLLPALNSSSASGGGWGCPEPASWGGQRCWSPNPRVHTVASKPVCDHEGAPGRPVPSCPKRLLALRSPSLVPLGPDPARPLLSPLPALLPSPRPLLILPLPPPTSPW